jgi:hypothetical protein
VLVLFDTQDVAVVPALVPVTLTAMNLALWLANSFSVVLVFPVKTLHVVGTVAFGDATAFVHKYHW